jgi:hypothetical protein
MKSVISDAIYSASCDDVFVCVPRGNPITDFQCHQNVCGLTRHEARDKKQLRRKFIARASTQKCEG